MAKRNGMISIHADLIDVFMRNCNEPLGASHIIDRLFESFKRSPPTRRQVGMYLKLNPHYQLVSNGRLGRLYQLDE